MSLVLTRKENEAVFIDSHIKVTVIKAEHGTVKLAFDAPSHIGILREELEKRPLYRSFKLGEYHTSPFTSCDSK